MNKNNRRSLSRNICCSVLTEIAVNSSETCQSGSRLLILASLKKDICVGVVIKM